MLPAPNKTRIYNLQIAFEFTFVRQWTIVLSRFFLLKSQNILHFLHIFIRYIPTIPGKLVVNKIIKNNVVHIILYKISPHIAFE